MAGGGGGAWKVAYADFVTAMMAFFLVMWLVGQSKEVKTAVAHYFQPPPGAAASELDPDVEPSLFPPRAELKIFHDIEKHETWGRWSSSPKRPTHSTNLPSISSKHCSQTCWGNPTRLKFAATPHAANVLIFSPKKIPGSFRGCAVR